MTINNVLTEIAHIMIFYKVFEPSHLEMFGSFDEEE